MSRKAKRDVIKGVLEAQMVLGCRPKCLEIFSMPRVTPALEAVGFQNLGAYDLGNGWDARRAADRHRILHLIATEEPEYVGMSPPCGPPSTLQNLTVEEARGDRRSTAWRSRRP